MTDEDLLERRRVGEKGADAQRRGGAEDLVDTLAIDLEHGAGAVGAEAVHSVEFGERPGGEAVSISIVVRVMWRSSESVPVSTMRPSRMIEMRSARASTCARMWLDRNTEVPRSVASAMTSWKTTSMSGSSPEVGSSRRSRSTSEASAEMSATFCRFPFE